MPQDLDLAFATSYRTGRNAFILAALGNDLRKSEGKEMFTKLVRTANVLVENLSPGSMDRLGLGKDVLLSVNPSLVYC